MFTRPTCPRRFLNVAIGEDGNAGIITTRNADLLHPGRPPAVGGGNWHGCAGADGVGIQAYASLGGQGRGLDRGGRKVGRWRRDFWLKFRKLQSRPAINEAVAEYKLKNGQDELPDEAHLSENIGNCRFPLEVRTYDGAEMWWAGDGVGDTTMPPFQWLVAPVGGGPSAMDPAVAPHKTWQPKQLPTSLLPANRGEATSQDKHEFKKMWEEHHLRLFKRTNSIFPPPTIHTSPHTFYCIALPHP